MNPTRFSIRFTVLFVVLTHWLSAQNFKTLETTALQEIKQKSIAGAAVAVINGDSLVFAGAFGYGDQERKIPATPDMLFRLGSTTKMFVATTALVLVDQGKLDLQLPIRTYVSGLPPKLGSLTMHQILSHTAGLFDDAPMFGPSDDGALGREIRSWTDEKIFLEPGQFISYSNPGYWLAGFVIETIAKKPFANAMEELVFRPLGMTRSTFRPEVASRYPLALGHDKGLDVIDPPANHSGTWPSGSMYSNVYELSRFVIAYLNDGMLDGKRVLPKRVIELLRTPTVKIIERPSGWYSYGLVFEVRRGAQYVFHTGGRNGYGSIIRMVPKNKFAVIALGNRTSAIMGDVADEATGMFVKLDEPAKSKGYSYLMDGEAARFEGTYLCPPKIELEFFTSGILHVKRNWERVPVRKYSDTEYTNSIFPLAFTYGLDGHVEYVHAELHTMKRTED